MAKAVDMDMVAKEFTHFASHTMHKRTKIAVTKIKTDLYAGVLSASPVGKTGIYRSSWEADAEIFVDDAIMGQISIWNPVIYSEPIEIGSKVGGRPWASAGPRTVEKGGRIWSSQAVGGVLDQVITEKVVRDMSEAFMEYVFKDIK